jgi:hypothetical protein
MMMRGAIFAAAGLVIGLPLASCLNTTANNSTWQYFDACSENTSFHEWVTCGKQNWLAACTASNNCSSGTNATVAYADSLDQSVQRHELTDAGARRKWTEYRLDREAGQRPARTAADLATEAVSSPVFCTNGKTMGC